ncbi:hypothetical protein GCM10027075_46660 [Streptomyces heilongjiangensis]
MRETGEWRTQRAFLLPGVLGSLIRGCCGNSGSADLAVTVRREGPRGGDRLGVPRDRLAGDAGNPRTRANRWAGDELC